MTTIKKGEVIRISLSNNSTLFCVFSFFAHAILSLHFVSLFLFISGMNQFSSDSSFNTKKKNSRSKYNKLTKEQKLEIIREWDRSRLSAASIATKFSMIWGVKLSSRGVADIISFWKENGKVRGFSQDNPVHLNVYNELHRVCQFCLHNDYPISKQDFKSMIQCSITIDVSFSYSTKR